MQMYYIFFFHSLLIDGHLNCFQFLTIVNGTTVNIVEQVSL